uniref:Uncharacterized protein n=1 Tax=Rhizophora mucronata TaxID=61149 RepID=A0A2P2JMQ7_RHIMU
MIVRCWCWSQCQYWSQCRCWWCFRLCFRFMVYGWSFKATLKKRSCSMAYPSGQIIHQVLSFSTDEASPLLLFFHRTVKRACLSHPTGEIPATKTSHFKPSYPTT